MKTGISVRDAMTQKPIAVKPDISVEEGAKIMLKNKVGSLIIQEGNKLLGMVTEKDFVDKVIARGLNAKEVAIRDIMKINVITISPDVDIFEAMTKMNEGGIRRLPVIENGKMIGFLTHRDVLKIQPQLFDLVVEHINIRESDRKLGKILEGECEDCGLFTILRYFKGAYLCDDCISK